MRKQERIRIPKRDVYQFEDLLKRLERDARFCLIDPNAYENFSRMLDAGYSPNARNRNGDALLHVFARFIDYGALEILLERKDLRYLVLDKDGRLPSELALSRDSSHPIAHALLQGEINEAKRLGLDYRAVLTGAVPPPEP